MDDKNIIAQYPFLYSSQGEWADKALKIANGELVIIVTFKLSLYEHFNVLCMFACNFQIYFI